MYDLFSKKEEDVVPHGPKDTSEEDKERTDSLKYRVYKLLYDFIQRRDQLLKELDLPKYKIPWLKISKEKDAEEPERVLPEEEELSEVEIQPQVSYF